MNNSIILEGCIDEFKSTNELTLNDSEVFELFCITQLTKRFDYSFEDIENCIIDGSMDGGIDSILLTLDDEYVDSDIIEEYKFSKNTHFKITISQIKSEKTFKETTLDKIVTTLPILFDLEENEDTLSERFNSSLISKTILLRDIWKRTAMKGGSISIYYYYCNKSNEVLTNSAFDSKVNQIIQLTKDKINGAKVAFENISSKELLDLYQSSKPTRLELKFKEVPITTQFNEGYGYVGIVSINDYYKFITDEEGNINENTFERNIRHYQGEVDVNNKIRESLKSEFEIDFWWMNNGITIIAESPNQISKTLSIENVQIVNGLQTTYTLGKYYTEIPETEDNRSILVKVIILDRENKEAIDKIIASTNSQNAVSPTLLRATDNVQRKIELFFFNKNYFYDRRKNFYKNLGKPATRIFTIQTAAQAIQAIMNFEPDTARAKPTTLIKSQETYDKIFSENVDFQVYLNCCLLNKKVGDYIKNDLKLEDKSLARAYSLHFARSLASFTLKEAKYSKEQIKELSLNSIGNDTIKDAFIYLKETISDFKETSRTTSDNSVSKSGKFREFLNEKLLEKFDDKETQV